MVAFVLMLCTNCNPDTDRLTDGLAIDMSVQIPRTKAMAKSVQDLQNSAIGIYGYKQQLTDADKKFLVFDNEKLEYQSNTWGYSPVRYWDTQTKYSYIAYSPYSVEDVTVNDFTGITISNIPQWQNADAPQSKDYIVALSDSAAVDYINGGGRVKLAFHHILANLQISAYYEGDDADFVITGLTLGTDTCKVPAVDANRSYSQDFGSERADGAFSAVSLEAVSVQITENGYNYTVSKSLGMAANFLVAPFNIENGKQLPLTITYTENGTSKTVTVNTGITQFESNNVYTLTLKFNTTTRPEVQLGPFGPGIYNVDIAGWAYSITNESRMNILSFDYNNGNPIVKSISSNYHGELLWQCSEEITIDKGQKLYIEHPVDENTTIKYYLTIDDNRNLIVTQNENDACTFKEYNPHLPGYSLGCYDKNGNYVGRIYWIESELRFVVNPVTNIGGGLSNSRCWRTSNIVECEVVDGYAGPVIYVNNRSSFEGFDVYTKELSVGGRLDFDVVAATKKFQYYYDGNMTRFYVDDLPNMYQYPPDQVYIGWNWSLEGAEGYAEIDNNGTITYSNAVSNDMVVIVTVQGIVEYNPIRFIEGYYRLRLKAGN